MIKKHLSLTLIVAMLCTLFVGTASADSREDKEAQRTEKVKVAILGLGLGPAARVSLKLRDNRKVEGYVSASDEDKFEVTDPTTGVATTVAYPQVGTARGNNLSQGAKIAIAVGASIAISILAYKYGRRRRRVIF